MPKQIRVSDDVPSKPTMGEAMKNTAQFYRKQAQHWAEQERCWKKVRQFCRQLKEQFRTLRLKGK